MTTPGHSNARRDTAHADVASTLWRERELLEQLMFALTCQRLVLSAGSVRFLTPADERVRVTVDELTDCELRRAIVTTELAMLLGLPGDATLEQLATHADAPWDVVFDDHRSALRTLAREIEEVTGENRRMLQAGAELAGVSTPAATSAYPGVAVRPVTGPMLFDGRA